jgi:hypothetical protein
VAAYQPLAPLMASAGTGLKAAIDAAIARHAAQPQPAALTAPVPMAAKALVTACQSAGFGDLAAALIAADAPEARVLADLETARVIKDRCAAVNLDDQAPSLIQAALTKGIGAAIGAVLALKKEQMDPGITTHLPANPRNRTSGGATVTSLTEVYAARRKARRA